MKSRRLHILLSFIFPGLLFSQSIDYPVDLDLLQSAELTNFSAINTEHLEFAPMFYNDGIIYVASNPKGKKYDKKIKESFFELKYYDLIKKSEAKDFYEKDINDLHHFGPCAFNPHEKEIFYSVNYTDKKGADGRYHMKLIRAVYENDSWKTIDDFPFNSHEYSIFHPAISADGQTLVFASNMPGGYGKMDLYSISKTDHGWSLPVNLGPEINSASNDWFPTFYKNDYIFFSSDGLEGLGGLDIYIAKYIEETWQYPQNLGHPVNSKMDDLTFALSNDGTFGFFSSNRSGGLGKDDIYKFQLPEPLSFDDINLPEPEKVIAPLVEKVELVDFQFLILDKETNRAIPKASLSFTPLLDEDEMLASEFKSKYIQRDAVTGKLKLLATPNPILLSQKEVMTTDQGGKVNAPLSKDQFYLVEVEFPNYKSQQSIIDVTELQNDALVFVTMEKNSNPRPIVKPEAKVVVTKEPVKPTTLKVPENIGELLVFENLLYEYNKATLKKGATQELQELADYMKKYPQLEVELSAHTDAIGSGLYNLNLSQKRANTAKQLLVDLGVNPLRIVAKGYGEQVIRNHCIEGVICTDDEHAYNRRTELKITKK